MRRLVVGLAMSTLAILLAPTWAHADDQQIADQIVKQLRAEKESGALAGFGIDLEVEHGVVWLKGHVADESQQDLVINIARNISGVEQVVNDLEVSQVEKAASHGNGLTKLASEVMEAPAKRLHKLDATAEPRPIIDEPVTTAPTGTASRSDSAIAEEIIAKLNVKKANGSLRDFSLDVNVDQGNVWLKGRVANAAQQSLVLDIARRVTGVTQVVNDLTIAGAGVRTAGATTQAAATGVAPQSPQIRPNGNMPLAFAPARSVAYTQQATAGGAPVPEMVGNPGIAAVRYDHPYMPGYAWPSYTAYPNYAGVTYPQQYSATAWPYIGPFYPYPQVPLGWRKASLRWKDGWWFLDFKSK